MRRRYRNRMFCDDPEMLHGYGPGAGYGFGGPRRRVRHPWHHRPWGSGPGWWAEEPEDDAEGLRDYVAGLERIVEDLRAEIEELKQRL